MSALLELMRFGGRCERHISVLPCQQCADEFQARLQREGVQAVGPVAWRWRWKSRLPGADEWTYTEQHPIYPESQEIEALCSIMKARK